MSKRVEMATTVVSAVSTVSAPESLPLSSLPKAYAPNHDRAERAEPLPQLQPGIRNRGPEGRVSRGVTQNNQGSTAQTAVPSSAASNERLQPRRATLSAEEVWNRLHELWPKSLFPSRTEEEERQLNEHRSYHKFKYDRVDVRPEGYPQLATFINNNDNWAVFRRFGVLSARALLQLEIELTELEEKLNNLDDADNKSPTMVFRLRGHESFRGWDSSQKDLIKEIREKLCEYFELLVRDSQVRSLGPAQKRHHLGLFHWMMNNKPLKEGKEDFIYHVEDFISTSKRSEKDTRLGDMIESLFDNHPNFPFQSFLQTDNEIRKTSDPNVEHFSTKRLKIVVNALATCISVGMLLTPVMLLFLVSMSRQSMAWIVFSFVMTFCLSLGVLTEARVQDILIGTAAYAAVLVTFLGNLS